MEGEPILLAGTCTPTITGTCEFCGENLGVYHIGDLPRSHPARRLNHQIPVSFVITKWKKAPDLRKPSVEEDDLLGIGPACIKCALKYPEINGYWEAVPNESVKFLESCLKKEIK